jgi:hypothetical protein
MLSVLPVARQSTSTECDGATINATRAMKMKLGDPKNPKVIFNLKLLLLPVLRTPYLPAPELRAHRKHVVQR